MTKIFTTSLFKQPFQIRLYTILTFVCLLGFSACKKTETDDTQYTALSVVNVSPTAGTYDVYLSGGRINNAAIPFGGAISYSQIVAGTYDLKFSVAGRTESLLTKSINLTQNSYFTFYLIDRPASLDGILVNDDLSATSTTTAFVRFINASPDAPALDLFVKDASALFTNSAYKTVSAFTPVAIGAQTFEVKDAAGALKATTESVTLAAGFYYTIIARGLVTPASGAEHPLSAQVIQNK